MFWSETIPNISIHMLFCSHVTKFTQFNPPLCVLNVQRNSRSFSFILFLRNENVECFSAWIQLISPYSGKWSAQDACCYQFKLNPRFVQCLMLVYDIITYNVVAMNWDLSIFSPLNWVFSFWNLSRLIFSFTF